MKVVHCPCGVDIEGQSDDELVAGVEDHVRQDHPDMAGEMTREKILEMAHDH
jgi:predicted small metal-binding protein